MTSSMHRTTRAIVIVLAIICASQISAAQDIVGEVAKLIGTAKLTRGGSDLEIVEAMPVAVGDKIRTEANGQVWVTFHDGSKAELGESSSMTIDNYALHGSTRVSALLKLWGGHLHMVVTAVIGGPPAFEVHTPNGVAAVRGTEFETAFVEGHPCPEDHTCMRYTTVGVSSGIVEVSNPLNPAAPIVRVNEGYESTIPCESPPTSPAPLGMEELGAPGYH
jgi:ferric-dicitrate binding protein FerR (iron transport regulator)